jgi:UDP-N-acetylglucosamine 2-epimerase (non-hydrolysing)
MIHFVIGTKAQLIKTAPVMKKLKERGIDYNYISTGQHKETIDDILNNFGIKKPDCELYRGKDITSVFSMLIWSLRIIFTFLKDRKRIFKNDRNGIVLVHGDTLSAVLGALGAKLSGIKAGHIESGLRSFNLFQPFPEEIFRILTFRLSDVMFCPGEWAVGNLKNYRGEKINTFSNTLLDSLLTARPAIENISDVDIPGVKYAVVTLHRFENVKDKPNVENIVKLLLEISKEIRLIFILHKITENKLRKFELMQALKSSDNIEMRKRYDYFRFIKLISHSEFVISDGGSNQEECFYLGKPVLLFRNVSERQEGLGVNAVLSKFDEGIISEFVKNYASYSKNFIQTADSPSSIIADYCAKFASKDNRPEHKKK